MANNRINKYIGAIALGAVVLTVPGCTDPTIPTEFDEPASGKVTLWEQISNDPQYSRFAEIAQKAMYYKDDTHPVPTYTFAQLLNSNQLVTLWAPTNDAISDQDYNKYKAMCGTAEQGYNLQQQFLGNHIALWRRNISEVGVDTVRMINGKNLVFDKEKLTFQDIPMVQSMSNIPASNGVLHTISGIAPFHFNFYEHLKFSDNRTKFGDYVVGKDTVYFDTNASIEGLPDENGNPTYVDEVYYTSNRLFNSRSYLPENGRDSWQMADKGFGARINVEDSVWVMLMPTDAAWDATYEKLKPYYQYGTIYDDKTKSNLSGRKKETSMSGIPADSLQKMSIEMDMIAPLVFNVHKQPKITEQMWTAEEFIKNYADPGIEYYLNTYGDTLRNTETWDKAELFNGLTPIPMSNGYAFETNNWNFPVEFYRPDVVVEVEGYHNFFNLDGDGSQIRLGDDSKMITFSNEKFSEITSKYGCVSNNSFYYFAPSGPTTTPRVEIKLQGNDPNSYVPGAEVMSGKYQVQVVIVPAWYETLAKEDSIPYDFYQKDEEGELILDEAGNKILDTEYIQTLANNSQQKLKVQVWYDNNSATVKKSTNKTVTCDVTNPGVQTLDIDVVDFPYSYKNMRFCYPTIVIEGGTTATDAKKGFLFDYYIDRVILKPIE